MQEQAKNCVVNSPENLTRRKAVKKLVVGAGLLAGYSVLPGEWTKPIVGQMALPAHAATSGPVTSVAAVASTATAAPGEYNTSQVYNIRGFEGNNKRFTWLDLTGASYGGQVKFVFPGCGELIVPNAAVTHGADGNTNNHNQAFYFCGTDFPKGSRENNNNVASVFAPPGCGATTVTMYYNK